MLDVFLSYLCVLQFAYFVFVFYLVYRLLSKHKYKYRIEMSQISFNYYHNYQRLYQHFPLLYTFQFSSYNIMNTGRSNLIKFYMKHDVIP
jgi:hypothetical protein